MDDLRQVLEGAGVPVIPFIAVSKKEEIGRGGFGKVTHGVLKADNSDVVLKQMLHDEPKVVKLFMKEIKFLSTTRHPNVVEMRAVCLQPLCPVMEYVSFDLARMDIPDLVGVHKGHNLGELLAILADRDLVESVGIARGVLQKVALDVAVGLAFLHSKDICHRDMKPANVLVANDGSLLIAKLTDFGEARSLLIQTNTAICDVTDHVQRGTPAFFAPEQMLEESETIDMAGLKKIDVWSFGMILFCLLNPNIKYPWQTPRGLPPTIINVIRAMNAKQLPNQSERYAGLQPELLEIFTSCSNYTPQERPDMDTIEARFIGQMFTDGSPMCSGAAGAASLEEMDPKVICTARPPIFSHEDLYGALAVSHPNEVTPLDDSLQLKLRLGEIPFYESLQLKLRLGETVGGPGHLGMPQAVCLSRGRVLVTDNRGHRLVVLQQRDPAAKFTYLSHVDIDNPLLCAVNPKSGLVYVSCMENCMVLELAWNADSTHLSVWRTLTAGGTLKTPSGICFDETGKNMYVACGLVHVVSIQLDTILSTLWQPEGVFEGPPDRIASSGSVLLVSYPHDKLLVLYEREDAMGKVIRPKGVSYPMSVAFDSRNFLVGDLDYNCIIVLDTRGNYVTRIGTGNIGPFYITPSDDEIYYVGHSGGHVYVLK